MIFRQLFDRETCTYTYLLADETTREAVLIDPVREQLDRDLQFLEELEVQLKYTLETHIHADHVTSSGLLRTKVGCQTVVSGRGGAACADKLVDDGDVIAFGSHRIEVRATPGHTDGCVVYVLDDERMVFTGDTMMIRGCGRTDFQQGSPEKLYNSVHDKIFSLKDDCIVYPGHDYKGRTSSTVAEEKRYNPRLKLGNSLEDFKGIMEALKLANPAKIEVAVPANQKCGWLSVDGEWVEPERRSDAWAPIVRTPEGIPEVVTSYVGSIPADVRLIDVRRPEEFTGDLGHVKGAELFTLDTLNVPAEGWDRDAKYVTICRSGGRSGRAARLMESMGFQNVASLRGGMLAWNKEGRPVEQ